jgi:hypothetical protein
MKLVIGYLTLVLLISTSINSFGLKKRDGNNKPEVKTPPAPPTDQKAPQTPPTDAKTQATNATNPPPNAGNPPPTNGEANSPTINLSKDGEKKIIFNKDDQTKTVNFSKDEYIKVETDDKQTKIDSSNPNNIIAKFGKGNRKVAVNLTKKNNETEKVEFQLVDGSNKKRIA